MGGSHWSDDYYNDRVADRVATHTPVFTHDADVRTGKAVSAIHDKLNPKGVKVRESRDSAAHPRSVAIAVMFDVTGSMGGIPVTFQTKLPQLMGLMLRKGYAQDPQILFGAVGDYFSDRAPLQIGQFESGIEMDEDVGRIYLEGNGGGQNKESYQNAFYFFARHTSIDCWEKRQHKGYLFTIGDEHPYPRSTKKEINDIFGDNVEADLKVEDMIREVQERYEVFHIIPTGASNSHDPTLVERWKKLVSPERVLMLEDPAAICELIGSTVGLIEGNADPENLATELKEAGVKTSLAKSVATALNPLAKATALARVGKGTLPDKKARASSTERL